MCEAQGSCRPIEELLDRPVERILEYRAYLSDLLQCGRKAGVDTHDLEVMFILTLICCEVVALISLYVQSAGCDVIFHFCCLSSND